MRQAATTVLQTLQNAGFQAFFAGGCVRDSLLGLEPHDWDVATSATPDQVAEVFPDSNFVGSNFGVSVVRVAGFQIETATFRTDGAYTDNRRPDTVKFTLDPREDVRRRDFTVNALLMDLDGNVHDFVGGQKDLANCVLRTVGDPNARFTEDALRLLRAVRFTAKLGFTMDPATKAAVTANATRLATVPGERVSDELGKMLTSGGAHTAFTLLLETGLAAVVLPELLPMVGCEHRSTYHPEGDVANHTRLLLAGLDSGCSVTLALASLLHDVAKPNTLVEHENRNTFHGHETVGADMTRVILRRLKFPNDVVDTVVSHVKNHMKFFCVKQMKRSTLMRFLRTPNFDELLALGRLDVGASNNDFSDVDFVAEFLAVNEVELNRPRLVNGDDLIALGMKPGPNFKVLLDAAETEQFEGRLTTRVEALAFIQARS